MLTPDAPLPLSSALRARGVVFPRAFVRACAGVFVAVLVVAFPLSVAHTTSAFAQSGALLCDQALMQRATPAQGQTLLGGGKDVQASSTGAGVISLHLAAENHPNPQVVRARIQADVNVQAHAKFLSQTAWHSAAWCSQTAIGGQTLLGGGKDVQASSAGVGVISLHLAAENHPNPQVVRARIQAGVSVQAHAKFFSQTPWHSAAWCSQTSWHSAAWCSQTSWHSAAWCSQTAIGGQTLLGAGARVNAITTRGSTPFYLTKDIHLVVERSTAGGGKIAR